jgi:uncharacterized transporter YbjL
MGLSTPTTAGLFCGALTSTPALATAVETTKNLSVNLPPETRELYISSPVVAYGLTYPFGVFGVILWLFVSGKFLKVDHAKESIEAKKESAKEAIFSRTFKVTNPAIVGRTVAEALAPMRNSGFVLSRIKKGNSTDIVVSSTVLDSNDCVVAVGDADAMQRAQLIFGEQAEEHLAHGLGDIHYRRIFVSNKDVVGKSIRELNLSNELHAIITRLRRGDVDIVPKPDTVLEMGDRIRVHTQRDNMDGLPLSFAGNCPGGARGHDSDSAFPWVEFQVGFWRRTAGYGADSGTLGAHRADYMGNAVQRQSCPASGGIGVFPVDNRDQSRFWLQCYLQIRRIGADPGGRRNHHNHHDGNNSDRL